MHRRRHGRVRTEGLAARLYVRGRLEAEVSVPNLSMGGALIRSPFALAPGTAIALELPRPGPRGPRTLPARVVTAFRPEPELCGPLRARHGVAFVALTSPDECALRALLLLYAKAPMALAGDPHPAHEAWTSSRSAVQTLTANLSGLLGRLSGFEAWTASLALEHAVLRQDAARPSLRPPRAVSPTR